MGRCQRVDVLAVLGAVVLAGCARASPGRLAGRTTTTPAAPVTSTTAAGAPVSTTAPVTSTTSVGRPATVTTTAKAARSTTTTTAAACPSTLPGQLASTGGGSQLVTVVATATTATSATVTVWQRSGKCWTQAAGPWSGRVGSNGLSSHHREGDGTTPIGLYGISSTFYGIAPNPGVHGSYHQLVCGDWWDEDPTSPHYNTFQHVACTAAPTFGGGSERLWQQTVAYQSFAVVDYNTAPVVAGAGSAIFVHDDTGASTNGCVSVAASNLTTVLRWLQPGQSPHIVIGTAGDIRQY